MRLEKTTLSGCYLVHSNAFTDARGAFVRSFDRDFFAISGLLSVVDHTAQASNPHQYTLRGMHFQSDPEPDSKLVSCTQGAAFDVAVDLRASSPTYRQWFGLTLEAEKNTSLYLPAGFAHGYLTLSKDTTLSYHLFTPYHAGLQSGFRYNDPAIAIQWPAKPEVIGERDLALPYLPEDGR